MKKILVALCVLASLSIPSCKLFDQLFYKADKVQASDLNDFSGSVVSSKDEALTSALVGGTGIVMTTGAAAQLPPQAQAAFAKIAPSLAKIAAAKPSLAAMIASRRVAAAPRTVTTTDHSDPQNGILDYKVSITDDEDFGVSGLAVNGDVGYYVKTQSTTTSSHFEANGSADLKASMDAVADTPFNGGKVNVKAKADGTADIDMSTAEGSVKVKGYTAIDISAGFSLSEYTDSSTGTTYKGGKYIVSFNFIEDINVDSTLADPAGAGDQVTVSVKVDIYNNDDALVGSYTYSSSDLTAAAGL